MDGPNGGDGGRLLRVHARAAQPRQRDGDDDQDDRDNDQQLDEREPAAAPL